MFKKYMNVEMVIEPGTHCSWVNAEMESFMPIDADQNLLFRSFQFYFGYFR